MERVAQTNAPVVTWREGREASQVPWRPLLWSSFCQRCKLAMAAIRSWRCHPAMCVFLEAPVSHAKSPLTRPLPQNKRPRAVLPRRLGRSRPVDEQERQATTVHRPASHGT